MKKVIVIGGAGFIGINICRSALNKGINVVIFDNYSRPGNELNVEYVNQSYPESIKIIKGDIRSRSDLEKLFSEHSDADAIFHMAGQVAVTTSVLDPLHDLENNLIGTFNILEKMRKFEIQSPLIYASTNKVYGRLDNFKIVENGNQYLFKDYPKGISEDCQLDFHSPYGCSKGAADQYVIDYSRIYGLETIVFRQSCIYGYNQFGIEDQGWVAWFTIASLFDVPITIYGDGKQVRDVLFIDDLVEAYWSAIDTIHITNGEAYNIGGSYSHKMSLLELIGYLEILINKKIPLKFAESRPGDQLVFISDVSKAQQHFGWSPTTEVKQGVKKLVDWAIANKQLFIRAGIIK